MFAQPKIAVDPTASVTQQLCYPSKDGTPIPMFLIRRADVAQSGKSAPTLLYGYGGFNISLTPDFSATRLAWLEQGGAVAIANLPGGSEYGASGHDGGRLLTKQNVFYEFIAAAAYLKGPGITGEAQIALHRRAQGGLPGGAMHTTAHTI